MAAYPVNVLRKATPKDRKGLADAAQNPNPENALQAVLRAPMMVCELKR